MSSGPVVRNALRRSGFSAYKSAWKAFMDKCDAIAGKGRWKITDAGVQHGGEIVLAPENYEAFVFGVRVATAAVPRPAPVLPAPEEPKKEPAPAGDDGASDKADKPTFHCDKRGCPYVGYTEKALEAHKRRAGH
jgi:hypothetical protein